ncbi:hypothetical protein K443DRAFT_355776 [Laccaria amethystina LaAM-08-1]|uniref:Uncharacterized protein n=1 Tax=Laccaria amethystina LaAM-08-1 TaxID=1095629 RepID=A0A0C9X001_9AGAR|nr:hypothetical protein K443DRAFT_355776 [Laccaria amethystina LaAM-08-1]
MSTLTTPPVLGMRRTHTLPLPLASQSSASGELSRRQRKFKSPLSAANGAQGVVSLSKSQGARSRCCCWWWYWYEEHQSPCLVLRGMFLRLLRGTFHLHPRHHRPSLPMGTHHNVVVGPFVPELNGRFGRLCHTWCVSWTWRFGGGSSSTRFGWLGGGFFFGYYHLELEVGVEGSFSDNFKAEVGLFRCNFKAESFSDNLKIQPVKYTYYSTLQPEMCAPRRRRN